MQVVGELAGLRDLREFPQAAARCLRALIPCDLAGYNALDLRTRRATIAADPSDCVFDGGPELLALLVHQNPMIERVRNGATGALRLSDHISRRDLHRTELYQHVYRRIPQEYQLGIVLPSPGTPSQQSARLLALSLGRTRRDFSDRHLQLLDLVGPHFAATLERLHDIALLRARIAGDPEHDSRWLLLVDPTSIIAWASPGATEALGLAAGAELPRELRPPTPQTTTLNGLPVTPRLIPDAHPGLDALRLTSATRTASAAQLRHLGLTRRQAEVLELALHGLTAARIADELTLSRRTVEKHLEHIYTRLEVDNRTQAIIAAATLAPSPAR
jgi:DNA-binding CsgD family transcriptional regulator